MYIYIYIYIYEISVIPDMAPLALVITLISLTDKVRRPKKKIGANSP